MSKTPQEFLQEYRRDQILEAAQSEIAACGYAQVSVDRIARAAGVSRSTVYQYFPSKEAILWGCVAQGREQLDAGWERKVVPEAPFEDQLAGFIEVCLETVDANRELFVVTAGPAPLAALGEIAEDSDMGALIKQFLGGLDRVLHAGIERGELPGSLDAGVREGVGTLLLGAMVRRVRLAAPQAPRPAALGYARFAVGALQSYEHPRRTP